jgi:hypothetical protein
MPRESPPPSVPRSTPRHVSALDEASALVEIRPEARSPYSTSRSAHSQGGQARERVEITAAEVEDAVVPGDWRDKVMTRSGSEFCAQSRGDLFSIAPCQTNMVCIG